MGTQPDRAYPLKGWGLYRFTFQPWVLSLQNSEEPLFVGIGGVLAGGRGCDATGRHVEICGICGRNIVNMSFHSPSCQSFSFA